MGRIGGLTRAIAGQYRFGWADYAAYLRRGEYPGSPQRFPKVEVLDDDGGHVRLRIGGDDYWWPSSASRDGLSWMYQEVFVGADQNPHAYEYGGVILRPDEVVVDAGACEGFFTRYALRRGLKVIAIEPVPSLARGLERTFQLEIGAGQVRVVQAALGSSSGTRHLESKDEHLYDSRLGETGAEVAATSLDDLLDDERIDILKMDIEGAEMEAIEGAARTLATQKPRVSVAVYHDVPNAALVSELLAKIQPDYRIEHRGIYAWEGIEPRPTMVYAW